VRVLVLVRCGCGARGASTGLKITVECSQRPKWRSKSVLLLRLMNTTSAALRAARHRLQSRNRRLARLKYCG
jgi:hypothetical protein